MLAINDTLWTVLDKAVSWDVNQLVIVPAAYYDRFVTDRLYLFEAGDFAYTADKALRSLLAGGVPINANKALWLMGWNATQDDELFAVDDFHEKTLSSHAVRSI